MPSISDLIDQYSDLFSDLIIVRLLGGDRKEIEKKNFRAMGSDRREKRYSDNWDEARIFSKYWIICCLSK